MKQNSEQQIDAVLAALRCANPPAEMEQRIRHAAYARAAEIGAAGNPRGNLSWLAAWTSPQAWRPLTVCLGLMAAALVLVFRLHAPSSTHLPTETQASSSVFSVARQPAKKDKIRAIIVPTTPSRAHGIELPAQPTVTLTADQQALDDTNAPSHPAPPMPLTAQERLLLRATRKGEPIEVAQLEPMRESALRAAVESNRNATLQHFVQRLLAPLVLSEAIHPTPAVPAPEPQPADPAAAPDPNQP